MASRHTGSRLDGPCRMPLPAPRTLVVRRHQLIAMCIQDETRLDSVSTAMQHRVRAHPGPAESELEPLNRKRQDRLRNHPTWRGQAELLQRVPGVGLVAAWMLIVELPELGYLKGHMAAAPVGRHP